MVAPGSPPPGTTSSPEPEASSQPQVGSTSPVPQARTSPEPQARPGAEPEPEATSATLQRWYTFATAFVAPASFLSALLFYFGYVSSRAQFRYFGVDVDTVGLSTRDYVMRSPQALLAPLLLMALIGTALVLLHRRLADRDLEASTLRRITWVGAFLVLAGTVLLLAFAWLGSWPPYPMVTALVLAVGLGVVAWVWNRRQSRRAAVALALVAVGTCVFWATATLAEWTGLGFAQRTARNLDSLPAVVLDTKERLYLTDGVVEEFELPAAEEQDFRYRYRGLRLLIHAGDRMFLVPDTWTPAGSTVVVPMDDVRVRFRFVNQPP